MDPFPSQTAEQALSFPDVAGWTRPVSPTRNQHRWAFVILIGLLTLLAATFEWSLLAAEGWTPINLMLFGLFTLLFSHVAIGFSQAFFGFLILSDRRATSAQEIEGANEDFSALPVTAIVIPVYNEEVSAVFARLRVMHDALRSLGALERFQFFVLSDSTDEEKVLDEKLAWARMVATSRRGRSRFLPASQDFSQSQERQHRRFLSALGQPVSLHDLSRCRQPDERADHRRAR